MKLSKRLGVIILTLGIFASLTGCSKASDCNGTYYNTSDKESYIEVSGAAETSDGGAAGYCLVHKVSGINSRYHDMKLAFTASKDSVKIQSPDNVNLYWTGKYDSDNYIITFNGTNYKK